MSAVTLSIAIAFGLPLLLVPITAIWRGKAFGVGRLTDRGDETTESFRLKLGVALAILVFGLGLLALCKVKLPAAIGLSVILPAYLLLLILHAALYNGHVWSKGRLFRMHEEPFGFWLHVLIFAALVLALYAGFVAALIRLQIFT